MHYTAASPNASVTSYYLFGGQRVAMNKGGTLTYLHGDHLGSASLATDGSGAVLNEGAFKPFGEPLGSSTFANDKTYTGQRFDSTSGGLMDYNARFYSPVLGRFVSADTIVPGAGNPQALNRYAYVFNNPLKFVDPSGHDPKDDNGNSTNTCAYGYGCNITQMNTARVVQSNGGGHYSPPNLRKGVTVYASGQVDLPAPNANPSSSLILVPAIACAIAAPCVGFVIAMGKDAAIGGLAEVAVTRYETGYFPAKEKIESAAFGNVVAGQVGNLSNPKRWITKSAFGVITGVANALGSQFSECGYQVSVCDTSDLGRSIIFNGTIGLAIPHAETITTSRAKARGISESKAEFVGGLSVEISKTYAQRRVDEYWKD